MTTVRTERLDLVPLPPPVVAALAVAEFARAAELATFPLDPAAFAEDAHVLQLRAAQIADDPALEPWLLRVLVLRDERRAVGHLGFHTAPDADGVVEVGYRVLPGDRRQGYAVEALRGLLAWGADAGVRRCLACVRPGNAASQAVARRLGFVKIGEEVDEVDGLEDVLALDLVPGRLLPPGPPGVPGGFA